MSSTTITLIVLGIIAILLIFAVVGIYNKLVTLKIDLKMHSSDRSTATEKIRSDSNLIETVKGYMAHEKETPGKPLFGAATRLK